MKDINQIITPKYLTPEKYSKLSGLGVEEIKYQITIGNIEGLKTAGGHYKVIIRDNAVSKEEYEKVVRENAELREKLRTINLASNI